MAIITDSIITDLAIALVTLLFVIYRWLASINNAWRDRGIPYVKPQLLFGNYRDLILGKRPIFDIQVDIYNKLEGEKFGGYYEMISPCLMVRDPELIEKILVKDFSHFVDRGESQVDVEREPLSTGLSILTGNQWRHMRYKLTPTFTSGKLKGMFEQIYNCGEELLQELKDIAMKGEAVDSKTVMSLFSSDVIASCAFGLQFKHDSEDFKVFRKMAESLFNVSKTQMLKFFLANYSSFLAKFIGPLNFPKDTSQYFINITKGTIDYREKNKIKRNDFLQLLLSLREQETNGKAVNVNQELLEEDSYLKQEEYKLTNEDDRIELTDEVLAAQAFLFLSAGSETISWVTSYTLHSLSSNPAVQEKAQREVDEVLAKHGGWTYQSVKDMTYLDQVVQENVAWGSKPLTYVDSLGSIALAYGMERMAGEDGIEWESAQLEPLGSRTEGSMPYAIEVAVNLESLRFNPFIVSLMRIVTTPYQIPGTKIVLEKGVRVNIPVYPLHMDPHVYPDPHTFDPERFKDNNHKTSWRYLPFGDGPRMCIGMRFALLEVKMCLAKILSRFTVSLSDKTPNPLQYEATFFPRPKGGIWLHFHERSLLHTRY